MCKSMKPGKSVRPLRSITPLFFSEGSDPRSKMRVMRSPSINTQADSAIRSGRIIRALRTSICFSSLLELFRCAWYVECRATYAIEIIALRIQRTDARSKVVRKKNYAVSAYGSSHIDFFHGRFGGNSVGAYAGPDSFSGFVGRRSSNFDLFSENLSVSRVSHRTSYIENSHFQPLPPILKTPGVSIFVIRKHGRRDDYCRTALFDFAVYSLNQTGNLLALEIPEFVFEYFSASQRIGSQR